MLPLPINARAMSMGSSFFWKYRLVWPYALNFIGLECFLTTLDFRGFVSVCHVSFTLFPPPFAVCQPRYCACDVICRCCLLMCFSLAVRSFALLFLSSYFLVSYQPNLCSQFPVLPRAALPSDFPVRYTSCLLLT